MYLELQQRTFTSEFVRRWVRGVYGGELQPATWNRWRTWAKMPKGVQTYTWEQLCFLSAIALIRYKDKVLGHSPTRQLCRSEVDLVANSLELQEPLAQIVRRMDAEGRVAGKDAPTVLGVDRATLYRNVPGFHTRNSYSVEYLRRFVNAG